MWSVFRLLLYGILMLVDEKFDQAEIFLEAATNFYPDCVEAWTVLGLYYDSIGKSYDGLNFKVPCAF